MRTIACRTTGALPSVARAGLTVLSWPYRLAVSLRNYYYQTSGMAAHVRVPVISVGNITTGGTGKTPFVAALFHKLVDMGYRPAILLRGYKAATGESADETIELALAVNCDRIVQNPDRIAGAEEALLRFEVDTLLLDDGFQHRRIARDLDIVLVDATRPFGYGHLLPRGLLREPPSSLARADLIVVTRCDQAPPPVLARLHERLSRLSPSTPVVEARHRPTALVGLDGSVRHLPGPIPERVVCVAGIANPASFAATVGALGSRVVATRWWPDHYRYERRDLTALGELARQHDAEALITTCKDMVKLRALSVDCKLPLWALRVTIDLSPEADRMLTGLLRRAVGRVGRGFRTAGKG
ncbi:MAG TPA: tetraacyldisaccharide 4'-kinase [Phycisphaerae bacterium]|nr:tetraacyldisaccharide 4'-kinase [Phycisphaerae bacterium]